MTKKKLQLNVQPGKKSPLHTSLLACSKNKQNGWKMTTNYIVFDFMEQLSRLLLK
jgi:hypothetical protein